MFFTKDKERKAFRKIGYFNDQKGIVNRMLREGNRWNSHLNKSKEFIMQCAKSADAGVCVVFGSGWLLDVPYAALAQMFTTLYFVDVDHPPLVKRKTAAFKNIILVKRDITGGTAIEVMDYISAKPSVKKNAANLTKSWSVSEFYTEYLKIPIPDFAVSINLLNQLDILICDYLIEKKQFTEPELVALRKKIQENHVKILPKGKSCLVTDFYEVSFDPEHKEKVDKRTLIYTNLNYEFAQKHWDWDFDTTGSFLYGKEVVFKVAAFKL